MNAATMSFRQLKAQTLNLILENKTTFCNHLAKSWTGFAKRILIFSPLLSQSDACSCQESIRECSALNAGMKVLLVSLCTSQLSTNIPSDFG